MENASDALIMAGNVLIFLIALTLCISSFTMVKTGVDNIITRPETVKLARGDNGYINYIQANEGNATRIVGAETIIQSIYRSSKENYVVYIIPKNDLSNDLKTKMENCGVTFIEGKGEINIIDPIWKISQARSLEGEEIAKFCMGMADECNQNINELMKNELYNVLKDETFYEYLGEYKENDLANQEEKTTKRIITYVQE